MQTVADLQLLHTLKYVHNIPGNKCKFAQNAQKQLQMSTSCMEQFGPSALHMMQSNMNLIMKMCKYKF